MEVEHVALAVSDLAAAKRFYCDGIGLDVLRTFTSDNGIENMYVGTSTGGSLQLREDPESDEVPTPAGIQHVAVAVDDVEAAFERVTAVEEGRVIKEPGVGHSAQVAFLADPDGYEVELIER
ncbi:MAG: VOC family protein [Salinigranum sp.]